MSASPTNDATDGQSPIKFGTSGWRGLIADDFTFANVRLAVTAIAEHVKSKTKQPDDSGRIRHAVLLGRIFATGGGDPGASRHSNLLCETFTPTPAVAYEIQRSKLDGAMNFTASHNPAQYHGLKFSSADAGPALPEVTKDIEARSARLFAAGGVPTLGHLEKMTAADSQSAGENYLKRIGELVRFDVLAKSKSKFVVDALHGCGAGYLDQVLVDNGVHGAGDANESRLFCSMELGRM